MARMIIPHGKTLVTKIDIEKIIAQVNAAGILESPGLHCRYRLPGDVGRFALITFAGIFPDKSVGDKLVICGSHKQDPREKCLLFEIPLARCVEHQKSSFIQTPADHFVLGWPSNEGRGLLVTMPAAPAAAHA